MSKTEPRQLPDVGFDVEINSGGRAYDAGQAAPGSEAAARELSATRAAAKERATRRKLLIFTVAVVGLAAMILWAWVSNPNTNVPSDAVARVNGEYISEGDIDREINLGKASLYLSKGGNAETPSRAAVLEDLISRKMQVQDAQKAGVSVSQAEVDQAMKGILDRTGVTQDKLQAALENYSLRLEDMRRVTADALLVSKYVSDYVTRNATDEADAQNKKNDWLTRLAQNGKIDRLKPSGTGPAPQVGAEAPDFTLIDLSGKPVKLSSLRGRPVLVNFWATWCPPCRAEIPTLVQAYTETRSADGKTGPYEILGVATQSDPSTVKAFVEELGINFPILRDTDNRVTSDLYHVVPIPTSFFIDKDGIIRYIQIGVLDRAALDKWLLR